MVPSCSLPIPHLRGQKDNTMKDKTTRWQQHPSYRFANIEQPAHIYLTVITKNDAPVGYYIGHTTKPAVGDSPTENTEWDTTLQGYFGSGDAIRGFLEAPQYSVVKFILYSGSQRDCDELEDYLLAQHLFNRFCLNKTFSCQKATRAVQKALHLDDEARAFLDGVVERFEHHEPDRTYFSEKNRKLREEHHLRADILAVQQLILLQDFRTK